MKDKVFGISLSKSGTTSICVMLEGLGYSVCRENLGDYEDLSLSELTRRMDKAAENYEGFQDSPWCRFYKRYAEMYPASRFILTLRPLDKWMNSMSNFGARDIPIWEHVYGVRSFKGYERYFRKLYRTHTAEAIEFFSGAPGRLLVLDLESDPDILARSVESFLGLKPTNLSFPKANASRRSRIRWLIRRWLPLV